MVSIGKEIRLSRLFDQKSGKAVFVAMDHGAILGPVPGIIDPKATVAKLSKEKPNAFLCHPELLNRCTRVLLRIISHSLQRLIPVPF